MPPGLSAERGARRPHAGLEQVPAETSGNGINQSKRREKGNVPGWKSMRADQNRPHASKSPADHCRSASGEFGIGLHAKFSDVESDDFGFLVDANADCEFQDKPYGGRRDDREYSHNHY